MSKFNPTIARLRLRRHAITLRSEGPQEAGKVARIHAVLELDGWPFDAERYAEFCREVGVTP